MPKSASLAPTSTLFREGVDANDVVANLPKDYGLQTEDNEYTHFVVSPSGTADPSASIYYWDDSISKWVLDADFTTLAGAGSNVPYTFSVQTRGRLVMVVLSAITAGSVNVYASTFGFSNRI